MTPTTQTYAELQRAFDHFNAELFDGQLPPCLIILQRTARVWGHFSPQRFVHGTAGDRTDEIAINPAYIAAYPIIQSLQTVAHELAHAWQFHCERAKDDVPPGLVGARNRQQKMTPYPQKASPVRNRRQLTSLVSEVASRWTDEPLPPRPLSAVRGSISVPPRGPLVSFESSIERDFLMFCRTSHRVTAVYAQRLVIDFQDVKRGAARRYTPDFVVEVDAAAGLSWRRAVVEVKTQRDLWRSRRMMRAPYAAARTWAAGQEGTIFRVVTDRMMSGEWLASTRLLSGHLDKPFDVQFEQDCVAFLQQRDSYRISEILALAQQRGLNPQALLPALYRMVARGQLSLDRGQPIGPQTWVTVVGSQKRL